MTQEHSSSNSQSGSYLVNASSVASSSSSSSSSDDEFHRVVGEDLCEWLASLYPQHQLRADNWLAQLADGVILCLQAAMLHKLAVEHCPTAGLDRRRSLSVRVGCCRELTLPMKPPRVDLLAKTGNVFRARDNICNFLQWCRDLGLPDTILFETEDLIQQKHMRNVLLCVLELARVGAKVGLTPLPGIVRLETEMDAEEEESKMKSVKGAVVEQKADKKPKQRSDLMELDDLVKSTLMECTCSQPFNLKPIAPGQYLFGEKNTCIFIRTLRNHVMVRVGGGWDTLNRLLLKHDPCRKSGSSTSQNSQPPVNATVTGINATTTAAPASASKEGIHLRSKTSPMQASNRFCRHDASRRSLQCDNLNGRFSPVTVSSGQSSRRSSISMSRQGGGVVGKPPVGIIGNHSMNQAKSVRSDVTMRENKSKCSSPSSTRPPFARRHSAVTELESRIPEPSKKTTPGGNRRPMSYGKFQ